MTAETRSRANASDATTAMTQACPAEREKSELEGDDAWSPPPRWEAARLSSREAKRAGSCKRKYAQLKKVYCGSQMRDRIIQTIFEF